MNIQVTPINQVVDFTEDQDPVVSPVIHLDRVGAASVQLSANSGGGDLEGTWLLEASNDYSDSVGNANHINAGEWVNLDSDSVDITAVEGVAIKQLVRLGVIDFLFMRITFTPTAGAGLIKADVGGKNI